MIDDELFENEIGDEALKVIQKWEEIAKEFLPKDCALLAIKYFDFSSIPWEIYKYNKIYRDSYLILGSICDLNQKSKKLEIIELWIDRSIFEGKLSGEK